MRFTNRPAEILLVEDNPADIELTREAMARSSPANKLAVVTDGEQALAYLQRQTPFIDAVRPGLILLDLNLPKVTGLEVLRTIKSDDDLKVIPVVVLTTSELENDIMKAYQLMANSYIPKPATFDGFLNVFRLLDEFWFSVVVLPPKTDG